MKRLLLLKNEIQHFLKNDNAHDFSHIMRVYRNAELICKKEHVDSELVLASVLLHDLVSYKKSDSMSKNSSIQSSIIAKKILKKYNFNNNEIEIVSNAILDHSFSKHVVPKNMESRILQDADRLDAIGAIGIARVFAVAGSEDRVLYNPIDPFCKNHSANDKKWTLDHFYKKLFLLEKTMNTRTGKLLAKQRIPIMKAYLRQLKKEIPKI